MGKSYAPVPPMRQAVVAVPNGQLATRKPKPTHHQASSLAFQDTLRELMVKKEEAITER
jgi:hypothetical protein